MLKSVRTLLCPRPQAETTLALVRAARRAQVQAIVAAASRLQAAENVNRAESTAELGMSLVGKQHTSALEPCRGEIQ